MIKINRVQGAVIIEKENGEKISISPTALIVKRNKGGQVIFHDMRTPSPNNPFIITQAPIWEIEVNGVQLTDENYDTSIGALFFLASGGEGGSGIWGNIIGNISYQSDLMNLLQTQMYEQLTRVDLDEETPSFSALPGTWGRLYFEIITNTLVAPIRLNIDDSVGQDYRTVKTNEPTSVDTSELGFLMSPQAENQIISGMIELLPIPGNNVIYRGLSNGLWGSGGSISEYSGGTVALSGGSKITIKPETGNLPAGTRIKIWKVPLYVE